MNYIFVFAFVFMGPIVALANPLGSHLSGQIFDSSSNNPILSTDVDFVVKILSPTGCVLYSEQHLNKNLADTVGTFDVDIGKGVAAYNAYDSSTPQSSPALIKVFDNKADPLLSGLTAADPGDCASSAYTPVAGDYRQVRIEFNANDGNGPQIIAPYHKITNVPYALLAEKAADAKFLDGKSAADFVEVSALPSLVPTFETDASVKAFAKANLPSCGANEVLKGSGGVLSCVPDQSGGAATPATTSATGVVQVGSGLSVDGAGLLSTDTAAIKTALALGLVDITGLQTALDDKIPYAQIPSCSADEVWTFVSPVGGFVCTATAITASQVTDFAAAVDARINADGTKLPLAGGTMAGAINMNDNHVTNTGTITMNPSKSLHLSNNASDPAGLTAADKGKMWFNSVSNEIKFWDGSAAVALNAGALTGVNVAAPLASSGGATPVISIAAGSTNGQTLRWNGTNWVAAQLSNSDITGFGSLATKSSVDLGSGDATGTLAAGRMPALTGDVTSSVGSLSTSVDKIKGKSVVPVTYAAGQVLRYDGTNWVNNFVAMTDLRSTVTGANSFASSCASNQTLVYNSVGDIMSCSDISLPVGQLTGALALANGGTGATTQAGAANAVLPSQASNSGKVLKTDGTNVSWGAFTSSQWTTAGSDIYYSAGNVGIGTSSPGRDLHISRDLDGSSGIYMQNLSNGTGARTNISFASEAASFELFSTSTTFPGTYGSLPIADAVVLRSNSSAGMRPSNMFVGTGGADPLHLMTNGTPRVSVDGAGYVGIGIVAPTALVHIRQDQDAATDVRVQNATDGASSTARFQVLGQTASLNLQANSASFGGANLAGGAAGAAIWTPSLATGGLTVGTTAGPLKLFAGSTAAERMRIDSTGNVGIGTSTPVGLIHTHVTGAAANYMYLTNGTTGAAATDGMYIGASSTGNAYVMNSEAQSLVLGTSASEKMRIDSAGNVGIGTATPSEKLDVLGKINGSELCIASNCRSSWPTATGDFLKDGSVAMTGSLKVPQGTSGAPMLIFSGDTNTGLFQPVADSVAISTNSTERLRIDSIGNMIINAAGGFILGSPANLTNSLVYGNTGIATCSNSTCTGRSTVLSFFSSRLSLSYPIEASSGTAATPSFSSSTDTDTGIYFPGTNQFSITTGGVEQVRVIASGNVGVGTTAPTAKLDVAGEVKFGNTSSVCDATTEGQQRYNSTTKVMQFCNGTVWSNFGGGLQYGGSYLERSGYSPGCITTNQLTGACSCPSGYTARLNSRGGYYHAAAWDAIYSGYVCEK